MTPSLPIEPGWFPTDLSADGRELTFVNTDRATLAGLACIADARWETSGLTQQRLPLHALQTLAQDPRPNINFIWHTAYCCSTLLADLIERPGANLSLREPKILVALSNAKRLGLFARRETEALPAIVLQLLARRFEHGETVTIKPAPAANYLIRDAAALTDGKMLFLYSDCASFLVSVALDGEVRRAFQRRVFHLILADGNEQQRWNAKLLAELSDLQIAALVWHMLIAEFHRALPVVRDRAASLDCDAFLAAPGETLKKLDQFFGLGLGSAHLEGVVNGPLMRHHAKKPDESFDAATRSRTQREIPARLKEDVEAIVAWSYEACRSTPREAPLPNALVSIEKVYR